VKKKTLIAAITTLSRKSGVYASILMPPIWPVKLLDASNSRPPSNWLVPPMTPIQA
jgi:hypothetical protein